MTKSSVSAERRHDIDWLRVLAVLVLFFFHSARIFDLESFYVKNAQTSAGFQFFIFFVNQWHMPLFFLISGVATWFALGSRGAAGYAHERLKRLFIPFLFGTAFIIPPQIYYMRMSGLGYEHTRQPIFQGSYFQFYPHFFDGVPPNGNFEWGHLWFLAYLFVFSLLALPLFVFFRKDRGQGLVERLARLAERRGGVFLFAIPLMLGEALLRARWPGTNNLYSDWANFLFYICFFIYGYVLSTDERFRAAIDRDGKLALGLAIGTFLIYPLLLLTHSLPSSRGYTPYYMGLMALRGLNSWLFVVAILSFGHRFLNFTNRFLRYANESALPVYILHQTVIVMLGYYVIRWQVGMMTKYFVIILLSLAITMALYDVFVKRIGPLRFLFGMRLRKSKHMPQVSRSGALKETRTEKA